MKALILGTIIVVIAIWVFIKSPDIFDDDEPRDHRPEEDGKWGDDD